MQRRREEEEEEERDAIKATQFDLEKKEETGMTAAVTVVSVPVRCR